MHLIYFDESGNTGNNLADAEQPIFLLGALVVPEVCWQAVERDLESSLAALFPDLATSGVEIHASELRGSRGVFKNTPVAQRVALMRAWLEIAHAHGLKLVYRSIIKKQYQRWMHDTFGGGVEINPHIAAFPLVATVVNDYLAGVPALGMFIADENQEIVRDVEKSIRQLRLTGGPLQLSRVIEKGFFIDSAKSRLLQLCDLCVLHARKSEEAKAGIRLKPIDSPGIELTEPLLLKGDEKFRDVMAWLKSERAKSEGQ